MRNVLKFKKILVVDDEPGIVENLEEILDMCFVDTACDFREGEERLKGKQYDAAVLDIMGVQGYRLLEIATQRRIPAVILTAHAFTPDNLVKSIKGGAYAYVPKWKIADIDIYVDEAIEANKGKVPAQLSWFDRLKPYFDDKFGPDWRKKHEDFWREYDSGFRVSKKELEEAI